MYTQENETLILINFSTNYLKPKYFYFMQLLRLQDHDKTTVPHDIPLNSMILPSLAAHRGPTQNCDEVPNLWYEGFQ